MLPCRAPLEARPGATLVFLIQDSLLPPVARSGRLGVSLDCARRDIRRRSRNFFHSAAPGVRQLDVRIDNGPVDIRIGH